MLEHEWSVSIIGLVLLVWGGTMMIPKIRAKLGVYHQRLYDTWIPAFGFIIWILDQHIIQADAYVMMSVLLSTPTFVVMIHIFTLDLRNANAGYFTILGSLVLIMGVSGITASNIFVMRQYDVAFGQLNIIASTMLGIIGSLLLGIGAVRHADPTIKLGKMTFPKFSSLIQMDYEGKLVLRRLS